MLHFCFMIHVKKTFKNKDDDLESHEIWLIGMIDENTRLEEILNGNENTLLINCREISKINSSGVKTWRSFFREVRKKNIRLSFIECSPCIVEQINVQTEFILFHEIISICLTFFCSSCGSDTLLVQTTEELTLENYQFPEIQCSDCGSNAEFDDVPEHYFSFLKR